MRRVLLLVALGCSRPPETSCREVEVAQRLNRDHVATCRILEMGSALALCTHDPAVYPAEARRNGLLKRSWDMSVDDCLREWVKVFDACEDEPDRQFRCERSP